MPILFLTQRPEAAAAALAEAGVAPRTQAVSDPLEALSRLEAGGWELVLVDAAAAGGAGLDLVEPLAHAGQPVVVLFERPTLADTVRVLRTGARDVLAFPPSPGRLRQLAQELAGTLPVTVSAGEAGGGWLGESPALLGIFRSAVRVAGTELPILLAGESGTGKASLARVLHDLSPRAGGPFVAVNCGALPEPVLQSELFGHERGALPGAYGRRVGRFRKASGGTLLLDELLQLTPRLQHAVLRALAERRIEPAGVAEPEPVDTRLIATVELSRAELDRDGRLLPELRDAFGGAVLELPPLRARGEADLRLLCEHFLGEFAARYRRRIRGLSPDAWRLLVQHPWPGNVRQLRAALEQGVIAAEGDVVAPAHLPREIRHAGERMPPESSMLLEDVEKRHILAVLELTGGHLGRTAERLGIHRNTLRRKLQGYGIDTDAEAK